MNELILPQGYLLIDPENHSWAESVLTRFASDSFARAFTREEKENRIEDKAADEDFWSEYANTFMERYRPYRVENGVLTVPVYGILMNKLSFALGGVATGYDYIEKAVRRGVGDPEVEQIVLDVNSPGGSVPGVFDAAASIYAMRGEKPINAVADEFAYSAAYAIASAADTINVAQTGGVGSIGVIAMHVDMSKRLEQEGVEVTLIYEGDRKADGHPAKPLSDEARSRMQARVNNIYEIFVSAVARNRGLSEQAVRDTEAATFMAREAVENGLADAVGLLGELSAVADPSEAEEDEEMSNKNDSPAADQAATETALEKARAEGREAGKTEGAAEERTRVATIMDSEEAKTRPAAARQIALKTSMSADEAKSLLAGFPAETSTKTRGGDESAKPGSNFDRDMMADGNPNVGANPEQGNQGGGDEIVTGDDIFASAGYPAVKQ